MSTATLDVRAEALPARDAPLPVDRGRLWLLALGHAITDTYGLAMLAPLLPLLSRQMGLTLAEVGGLTALMGVSASLGQPLWGFVSDRWPRASLVALGPAVAALACGTIGLATGYWSLALCLFGIGIGVGAFHPQAASLARTAGRGGGLAMSVFTVGGNVGFGLAPLLGTLYLESLGLQRFYWASIPGVVVAVLLAAVFGGRRIHALPKPHAAGPARKGNPRALAFLTATVVLRSAVQIGMVTFLPFVVAEQFPGRDTTATAGMVVSAFLLASALSGPVGGHLADRVGQKRVMSWSFVLAPWPLLLAFQLPGYWSLVSLALGGFILMLPHPANVVMAQEFMPRSAGIAASMITGFAWGLAQFMAKPVGMAAEAFGTVPALLGLSLLPLVGALFVFPIPEREKE